MTKKTSRKNEITDITHRSNVTDVSTAIPAKTQIKKLLFQNNTPIGQHRGEKETARENKPNWQRRCAGAPDTIVMDPKIMSIKCRRLLAFYSSLLVKFSSPPDHRHRSNVCHFGNYDHYVDAEHLKRFGCFYAVHLGAFVWKMPDFGWKEWRFLLLLFVFVFSLRFEILPINKIDSNRFRFRWLKDVWKWT